MEGAKRAMKLTEVPEIVHWPESHYVFIERIGPFMNTAPAAWGEMHRLAPEIHKNNQVTGYTSFYKIAPQVYRAGLTLADAPRHLPPGVRYEKFPGGKYSRFTLTGPYANLPEASGRVVAIVDERKIKVREDFWIENYANDPRTTPEDELITQIHVPTS